MSIWRGITLGCKGLWHGALNALLPRLCLSCQADSGSDFLCAACREKLPHLPAACPVCAHPHAGQEPAGLPCGRCQTHPPHYDATLACFAYAPPIDQLIQSLKYGRRLTAADFLATQLVAHLASLPAPAAAVLMPMPLSAKRLAERGFNQAVELARPLARHWQMPLDLHSLSRPRHTVPQVELPWKARAKNIRHAFAVSRRLDGQHVLVVDDVMTTGATLNEVARTLKEQGAARVTNLVLARTLRDQHT